MIHVLAFITTQPGQRDTVLKLFQANVPAVLAESGCIAYEATIDSAPALKPQTELGADTFVVVEKWESVAALEAHFVAPHMVAYSAKVKDLIADRAIHILSPA
jgi:quinol monooxygenase YgiN